MSEDNVAAFSPARPGLSQAEVKAPKRGVLEEADGLIRNERRAEYGPVEDSFSVIGDLWATYLRGKYGAVLPIDGTDVALMMVLMKTARCATGGVKRDTLVDIGGYTGLTAQLNRID